MHSPIAYNEKQTRAYGAKTHTHTYKHTLGDKTKQTVRTCSPGLFMSTRQHRGQRSGAPATCDKNDHTTGHSWM